MTTISAAYYEAIDLLKAMITCPSFSREEKEVADLIENYLLKAGLNPCRTGNNVWAASPDFDAAKSTLLLNSHIDTVKPAEGWTKDPFHPEMTDERLYGLGSNDAGASVVSLMQAFLVLIEKKQPCNLVFLASCEEEISGKNGLELALNDIPTPAFAVVGEPTDMNPAVAEKGLMVLDCTANGKSGHAARNEGDNAIYKALRDIEWISAYQFPDFTELLGKVKMSVTMIEAGTQHNVIPDVCRFVVDVRSNECYSNEEVFRIIDKHTLSEVKPRSFRLNSSRISLDHPFVRRALLLGKQAFGSPTLSDQALMPFPSVKIGPGDSARSHTADEYILLGEIREAIEYYIKLLDGLEIA
ncbi:MAG: M20 family metallo-hydrolase [Prevotella sp.]|jgi:acetylornithine deacetylase|nr:M20 family metallo-hydrolase [Prevotella sp.]